MRVPVAWLRAYCDPGLSAGEIAERLNTSGTEVERIDRVGVGDASSFVVGKVVDARQHPDADRLRVCKVDDGSGGEPRTIVCGAPNVESGQTVAVALPGAVMPNGEPLGEAKLRGVVSSGMILAEDEVGVGEDHGGIMVLPDDLPAGAPLIEHLQIADEVLDLAVAPNRPDCLSVYGVAREVHATAGARLAEDPSARDATPASDDVAEDHCAVAIEDPDICLRFTARVFEDVKIGPSPLWLKARLSAAGQRPISNVVDITNYVMLLTGQPLHAFDLDLVRGGQIVVRKAKPGERITTLDGVDRELDPEMAVVCDAEGPSGIAGIMGGQISEVSDATTRVLMEAATWVGPNIMRSESRLALRTEASNRFEKQLHPELAMAGQRLAARLMVELCGARMVRGTLDAYPRPAEPRVVQLRLERIERILGVAVPRDEVLGILARLGFRVVVASGAINVEVPYWRDGDVQREADLVEEVGRVYGLERIPRTLPARRKAVGGLTRAQRLRRSAEDALRHRGADEIVAYSFTSPEKLARLRLGDGPLLRLANPLSEEHSVMRPLLLPGLLDAARHNAAHGRPDVALFESAHVYLGGGELERAPDGSPRGAAPAEERHHLGALFTRAAPGGWRTRARGADFYSAKGMLEGVLATLAVTSRSEPAERPFLHPGRSASVLAGDGRELGWIGELHPLVAREWDLEGAAAFEIDLDLALEIEPGEVPYRDVTTYPAVVQDIAVVAPEEVPAARIEAAVRAGGGELLDRVHVFDLYYGEQLGKGNRSLALRLEFRSPDRTLTDEDVAQLRQAIEARLGEIGGRLRA
jgi:phenylalanyl-tRNA synthetase beta chain